MLATGQAPACRAQRGRQTWDPSTDTILPGPTGLTLRAQTHRSPPQAPLPLPHALLSLLAAEWAWVVEPGALRWPEATCAPLSMEAMCLQPQPPVTHTVQVDLQARQDPGWPELPWPTSLGSGLHPQTCTRLCRAAAESSAAPAPPGLSQCP